MAIRDPSGSGSVVTVNGLDAGNPLHVQNSDNSNSVIIPLKLLGIENYRIWSGAVKLALQDRNKNKTYDKVDGFVVYNLLQKNNSVKQGGSSVADYYHILNSLWREFNALINLPKCTCEVKCRCDASKELGLHQQLMKLMQFLMGLDDCYQPVRSSLLTRVPLLEVKDAYNVVSMEKSHRGVPKSSGVTESKQNATSFVAKTFNNNRRQFNNNNNNFTRGSASIVNRGPNPKLNCKHCGKINHTIDRCFEIVGFPQGFKRNSNTGKQTFNDNVDVKMKSKLQKWSLLESIKSDLEKASAMAATTTNSAADDLKTNETKNLVTVKSIISRLESSTTFGNYRLTKLDLEEASSTAISTSGDEENTLKSSSSSPSFGSYDSPKSDPEDTKTVDNSVKSTSNSMRVELDSCNSSFGSYGSMRKEKEWKRTLACKLFEERRSLEGGGEGMDSLWEAYEDDNTNKISRSSKKNTNVKKNNKAKSEFKYFDDGVSEDGDEDDEFMGNGQLCCLKALKMSTGKMNLGMGKPNLVKISKALKGFGWLHHRHGRKMRMVI
nr:ribonuclease H-like domain-containing protein [Tanacetum cinerariifolium]